MDINGTMTAKLGSRATLSQARSGLGAAYHCRGHNAVPKIKLEEVWSRTSRECTPGIARPCMWLAWLPNPPLFAMHSIQSGSTWTICGAGRISEDKGPLRLPKQRLKLRVYRSHLFRCAATHSYMYLRQQALGGLFGGTCHGPAKQYTRGSYELFALGTGWCRRVAFPQPGRAVGDRELGPEG